jgi:hypothetical protein
MCRLQHNNSRCSSASKMNRVLVPSRRKIYLYICVVQPLCYFKVQQVYTVKHKTSNIKKNTLHWRHVSAYIVTIAVISVRSRFA